MNEPNVMVYLMTGFLDSGKTQFLTFTLKQIIFRSTERRFSSSAKRGRKSMIPWKCSGTALSSSGWKIRKI